MVVLTALTGLTTVAGRPASAAPEDFPPGMAPFRVEWVNNLTGQTQCMTIPPEGNTGNANPLIFEACDPLNMRQNWVQRGVDAEGHGMVYAMDGRCISNTGAYQSRRLCELVRRPAALSWKQQPDGQVRSKEYQDIGGQTVRNVWTVTRNRDDDPRPTLEAAPPTNRGGEIFTITLLPPVETGPS